MQTPENSTPRAPRRAKLAAAGLISAGALAGAVLAGTLSASAATQNGASGSTSGSTASTATPNGTRPVGGATPVRDDEKSVSTDESARMTAAAEKAVPGGTVYRVETDAGDAAYEAHVTEADGTQVTVKFDTNLAVVTVETGMGQGDPAPAGPPNGANRAAPQGAPGAGAPAAAGGGG